MSTSTTQNSIQIAAQANIPVLIWGVPGIGKTAYMMALAEGTNKHIEVVITSIREPSDFGGLPVVKDDGVMMSPPQWAKNLKEAGEGILFLDEISTAAPAVQAACLRVIHDRVVGDLKLPDDVSIVAAANPPEIAAGGWDLSAPLANRFCHLDWDLDTEAWINGMVSGWPAPSVLTLGENWREHLPSARSLVSSFINAKRSMLLNMPDDDSTQGKAWPSARTWDMASTLLAACMSIYGENLTKTGSVPEEVLKLVAGCVGEGPAMEFVNYMKDLDLPDPEVILKDPEALTEEMMERRQDRLFAILSSVTSAILANNTPNRWHAGWFVLERVVNHGIEDIAAQSARALAKNQPEGASVPQSLQCFVPILKEAGLLADG